MGKGRQMFDTTPGISAAIVSISQNAVTFVAPSSPPTNSPTSPEMPDNRFSPPSDLKEQRRRRLREIVNRTWRGLHIISNAMAPLVPGPLNVPLELFNTMSDLVAKHIDNRHQLGRMMEDAMGKLEEVEEVCRQGEKYNPSLRGIAEMTAREIMNEIKAINEMGQRRSGIVEQEKIAAEIGEGLGRLNRVMAKYQRDMLFAMAANLENVMRNLTRADLFTRLNKYEAPNALFNATSAGRAACVPGTHTELLHKIKSWAEDSSVNSSPIFWLSGSAGTGKSTVSYTVCEHHLQAKGLLGASFFCSRNDLAARSRHNIIPYIVMQLLNRVGLGPAFLSALCALPVDEILPVTKQHVDVLLVQPWLRARASEPDPDRRRHLVVVLDALDEVENNAGSNLIADLVKVLCAEDASFSGIKFLITGRPELGIVEACSSIEQHAVCYMEQESPDHSMDDMRRGFHDDLSSDSDTEDYAMVKGARRVIQHVVQRSVKDFF